jgi:hypothetical protein
MAFDLKTFLKPTALKLITAIGVFAILVPCFLAQSAKGSTQATLAGFLLGNMMILSINWFLFGSGIIACYALACLFALWPSRKIWIWEGIKIDTNHQTDIKFTRKPIDPSTPKKGFSFKTTFAKPEFSLKIKKIN